MFIVSRLTSRSSVALSVSIGYACTGAGGGSRMRSRSPDDDASYRWPIPLYSARFTGPERFPRQALTFSEQHPRSNFFNGRIARPDISPQFLCP